MSDPRIDGLYETAQNGNKEIAIEAVKSLGRLAASGNSEAAKVLTRIATGGGDCYHEVRVEATKQLGRVE